MKGSYQMYKCIKLNDTESTFVCEWNAEATLLKLVYFRYLRAFSDNFERVWHSSLWSTDQLGSIAYLYAAKES